MTVKKQPESSAGELCESANDWFRQFLKHLEIYMAETGQALRADSESAEFCLAAMRAVKLTLRDSGVDEHEIVNLIGRIVIDVLRQVAPSRRSGTYLPARRSHRPTRQNGWPKKFSEVFFCIIVR